MRINKKDFVRAGVNVSITPGQMLKTLRELQGLSQKELADKTGMTQSNISALETDASQMGRERAIAIATVLKVHPAVILFPDYDIAEAA